MVYWEPAVDPGTVILTGRVALARVQSIALPDVDPATARYDPDGTSFTLGRGLTSISLMLLDGPPPDQPLAALVPLDATGLDRIDALTRFWRILSDRPSLPDTRLTAQRRRRLRFMLQAVDGHLACATYREIANAIYGRTRVASHPWKTSALRDSTISLVKDGHAMIAGGYRKLLRHRRR